MGQQFNRSLEIGDLPPSLEALTFGVAFNRFLGVGVIPEKVKSVVFGTKFNQPLVVGTFPKLIKSIEFGWNFNQPLPTGVIPPTIETLKVSTLFDQKLLNLPDTLKELQLSKYFDNEIKFPLTLEKLEIISGSKTTGTIKILKDHKLVDLYRFDRRRLLYKESLIIKKFSSFNKYFSFVVKLL